MQDNNEAENLNFNNNNNSFTRYYRESNFYTTTDDNNRRSSELSPRVSNHEFNLQQSTSCDQSINFVPVNLVLHGDGPPWGFSLKGGKEHNKPIVVTK